MLVIVGSTGVGNSELARHVHRERMGGILRLRCFLEVTIEESNNKDMSEFNEPFHNGVLLDGVADSESLAQNREVLQGRAKATKGDSWGP